MTSSANEMTVHEAGQSDRAVAAFTKRFGRRPSFAAAAPGRVNLIGEHTDYNRGYVLPMAIDRRTLIVADRAAGSESTLWSMDLDQTAMVNFTKPLKPTPGAAANYLIGVAQQFIERGLRVPNLDAAITSTIPMGAGLSSSAAVEVAFATLLELVVNVKLDSLEKALLCQRAEQEFAGTPCGIMDMLTAVCGKSNHALLIDCMNNQPQPIPMPDPNDATVLIINTKVKRELARSEYALRRAECEAAAESLGLGSLRQAAAPMLKSGALTDVQRRRALHVISENTRTVLAAEALASGNLRSFGELMFAGHDSLRDLFEVSCAELDAVVDAARSMQGRGVHGARMTGGGFGGCAVVLCETETLSHVKEHVKATFRERFGCECELFAVCAADGARMMAI